MSTVKILAIGDIMGRLGRKALEHFLPKARAELAPDFILVNGENAAGGFGLTRKIFNQFVDDLKINCVTMGNHWFDKKEIYDFLDHPALILPCNMGNVDEIKNSFRLYRLANGSSVVVMNLIGKIFMKGENRCPFQTLDAVYRRLPDLTKIRILDFHGEATSEKQGVAHYLKGRASLVYGTHSHVPTGDERIIEPGTAFITDLGMTGPYDSVIGIRAESAIQRMRTNEKKNFEPVSVGEFWLCGVFVEVDEDSGKALSIQRIRWQNSGV